MKRWNVVAIGFAVVMFVLTMSAYSSATLIDEMVVLDRSYVAALVLSNQPDKPAAAVTASMKRLTESWKKFVDGLSPADRANKSLATAITQVSGHIAEAEKLAIENKRKDAHEALEGVRVILWKARSEMGIQYLPDKMTAFHEPMEEFVDLAEKTGADKVKLNQLLEELSAKWKLVENSPFDAKLFGFNDEKVSRYNTLVNKEREIITSLSDLIKGSDQAALAKAAGAVKSNFSQTYMLFGDFSGLGL
jgi:hypothetical protein